MPYSIDPDANQNNPKSPSPVLTLETQLIYKIGSMESTITNSLRRLDEKFDRLQGELHDRYTETAKDTAELSGRVSILEKWQTQITARTAVIGSIVIFAWTFIAPTVRHFLGLPN